MRTYWKNLGITRKLMLAFGSIEILILITIALSIFFLHYAQHETEDRISNSARIKNLVLEMSWRLEKSRGVEKNFFLQYMNLGFAEAMARYIDPTLQEIKLIETITAELTQRLTKSSVWQEGDSNLALLYLAQFRHASTMNEAIVLVTRLAEPNDGLVNRLFNKMASLRTALHAIGDRRMIGLMVDLNSFGYDYMIGRRRPSMQSSFNSAELLRERVLTSTTLPALKKTEILTLLSDYINLGEEIIQVDLALRNKLTEFELQTEALNKVSTKMIAAADQEFKNSQARITVLYWIIIGLLCLATLIILGIIVLVAKIVGSSISDNIILMSQAIKKFETGDLDVQLPINSTDELGKLAGGFNRMASRIKALIDNLEQMVAERTSNLSEANKQLHLEIAERIQSQQQLRKSETLLKATQQLAKIGGWEWDVDKQTIFYTDEVFRIHELVADTMQSDHENSTSELRMSMDAEHRDLLHTAFHTCIDEAKPYDIELPITTAKGNRIWIRTTAQPIVDAQKVVKVLGCTMDITASKQAAEQIKASLREKEVLLQEIHHRVKNNMQVVASLIKLQISKETDERVKLILSESYGRVYAMSAIHEALHQSASLTEIDVTAYLSKIARALFQTFSTKPAHVDFDIDSAAINLTIEKANPLGLVVNELISNSLKHAFPNNRDGKIAISIAQPTPHKIRLIVADDGIGFPANLDWRNTSSLGLQLVKTLVENQLDGSIQLELAAGTSFTIDFPIDEHVSRQSC